MVPAVPSEAPAHAAGVQCGGGLDGPKAKETPKPMRWEPQWPQSEGDPVAHAAGASVVPKVKEAPSPMRRGPR